MTRPPPILSPPDTLPPTCPYCGASAVLRVGTWGYQWRCAPCDAHVGCHGSTTRPKGTLANRVTRAARIAAHEAFDPLWRLKLTRHPTMPRRHARDRAYAWLADQMGLPVEACHIAMFTEAQCRMVVALCEVALHNALARHPDDLRPLPVYSPEMPDDATTDDSVEHEAPDPARHAGD